MPPAGKHHADTRHSWTNRTFWVWTDSPDGEYAVTEQHLRRTCSTIPTDIDKTPPAVRFLPTVSRSPVTISSLLLPYFQQYHRSALTSGYHPLPPPLLPDRRYRTTTYTAFCISSFPSDGSASTVPFYTGHLTCKHASYHRSCHYRVLTLYSNTMPEQVFRDSTRTT